MDPRSYVAHERALITLAASQGGYFTFQASRRDRVYRAEAELPRSRRQLGT
jgi:hypothetical protein